MGIEIMMKVLVLGLMLSNLELQLLRMNNSIHIWEFHYHDNDDNDSDGDDDGNDGDDNGNDDEEDTHSLANPKMVWWRRKKNDIEFLNFLFPI